MTTRVTSSSSNTLDTLPEELLDQIVFLLRPPSRLPVVHRLSALYNLSLVSKRLNKIAVPHLYHAIPLVLNRSKSYQSVIVECPLFQWETWSFHIPTTERCNAHSLVRTLTDCPYLRKHVRVLLPLRLDYGFRRRRLLGMYGYEPGSPFRVSPKHLERAMRSPTPTVHLRDILRSRPIIMRADQDPAYVLLWRVLRLTHNLQHLYLDYRVYHTDSLHNPLLGGLQPSSVPYCFDFIREVVLCCQAIPLTHLSPLFVMPSLESLEISLGVLEPLIPHILNHAATWNKIAGMSKIKSLSITHLHLFPLRSESYTALPLMSMACFKLRALRITTGFEGSSIASPTRRFLSDFEQHIPNLRVVEIHSSAARPHLCGVAALQTSGRAMGRLRASTKLQHLVLEAHDLVEESISDLKYPPHHEDLGTMVSLENRAGEPTILYCLDPALPVSLETLTLRISSCHLHQKAVDLILRRAKKNLSRKFPHLRAIKIFWYEKPTWPFLHVASLQPLYEEVGVEVVEGMLE